MNYVIFCFLFVFISAFPVYAHKPSDSYLTFKRVDSKIHGQWDISLRDLDYAIGLDLDSNGEITWGELRSKHEDISKYALSKFKMKVNDGFCTNIPLKHLVDNHSDGTYSILEFEINCPEEKIPKIFDLKYDLFFDLDQNHKGILKIIHKDKIISSIFGINERDKHFNLDSNDFLNQFIVFTREGIWHIWIVFDHILFLLALLLPAVFIRKDKQWERTDFKTAFWNIFKIVTAFTIAHSITLSLAVLNIIELPSRFIESTIAASVFLAALNNIFPILKEGRWVVAFVFGLIHGFGFASVLTDLGLIKGSLVVPLLSFNIGVEIGQLVILSVFLPISYVFRKSWFYEKIILSIGSLLICFVSLGWFIERVFDFKFMPF